MVNIGCGHGKLGCGEQRRWAGGVQAGLANHICPHFWPGAGAKTRAPQRDNQSHNTLYCDLCELRFCANLRPPPQFQIGKPAEVDTILLWAALAVACNLEL